MYIENPKMKGSGMYAAIPQSGVCTIGCSDCFFTGGRSYLEPLEKNLPNMPVPYDVRNKIVRINDGNDSNNERDMVIEQSQAYPRRFYNTSMNCNLDQFDAPVVLTLNPGEMTDKDFHVVHTIPKNLMMVRVRTNTWNLNLVDAAVAYYTEKEVPVILTFMAYYHDTSIPLEHKDSYIYRKRTTNSYWAITTAAWRNVMKRYEDQLLVYSCGKIEGEKGKTSCKYCGNCLREFFSTMERLDN